MTMSRAFIEVQRLSYGGERPDLSQDPAPPQLRRRTSLKACGIDIHCCIIVYLLDQNF